MNKGKKRPFKKRVPDFIGDKGFYIVLFLCVAVIGITSWILSSKLTGPGLVDTPVLSTRVNPTPTDAAVVPTFVIPTPDAQPPATAKPAETAPHSPAPSAEPDTAPDTAQTSQAADTPDEPSDADKSSEPVAQHFLWPLSGAVETPHSVEALLYDKTMADWRTHTGLDIAAAIGAKVMAASDGTVERVFNDEMYGTTVVIRHMGGLTSIYSNLAATPTVNEGDAVRIGDVIGSVGDTALAEAGEVTHLHFGMELNGTAIDPTWYLPTR